MKAPEAARSPHERPLQPLGAPTSGPPAPRRPQAHLGPRNTSRAGSGVLGLQHTVDGCPRDRNLVSDVVDGMYSSTIFVDLLV